MICEDACEVVGADTKLDGCGNVTDARWNDEFDTSDEIAMIVEDVYAGGWYGCKCG